MQSYGPVALSLTVGRVPDTVLWEICSSLFGPVLSEKLLFVICLQHGTVIINVQKTGLLQEWSCKQMGEAAVKGRYLYTGSAASSGPLYFGQRN